MVIIFWLDISASAIQDRALLFLSEQRLIEKYICFFVWKLEDKYDSEVLLM